MDKPFKEPSAMDTVASAKIFEQEGTGLTFIKILIAYCLMNHGMFMHEQFYYVYIFKC